MTAFIRYAVYHVPPPDDPLGRRAAEWLGRDHWTGADYGHRPLGGFRTRDLERITAAPRRYGFHATLRSPFTPKTNIDQADLTARLRACAAQVTQINNLDLEIRRIGPFFALVPTKIVPELDQLAAACVTDFDNMRRPIGAGEIMARARAANTPRRRALLARWGYPFVFDQFRYHMTLTGPVDDADADRLAPIVADWFDECLQAPRRIMTISLCGDPGDGAPFQVVETAPLSGADIPVAAAAMEREA